MKYKILFILCVTALCFQRCQYDAPTEVWNPDKTYPAPPQITSLKPDGSQFTGAMVINIIGANFGTQKDQVNVYFGNEQASILTVSDTEISVKRPVITGDSLVVKVVVNDAVEIAEFFPYKLSQIASEYSSFLAGDVVYGVAMDAADNLYVMVRNGVIFKVSPDGVRDLYTDLSISKAEDLKVGPGGDVFLTAKVRGNSYFYRVLPEANDLEELGKIAPRAFKFDYTPDHNIYFSGDECGAYFVDENYNSKKVGGYDNFDVRAVRVYNGYLYLSAVYNGSNTDIIPAGIYKSEILADGELGPVETVFDWRNAGDFSELEPGQIAISEDGDIVIGTDYTEPLLYVHSDGTAESLYPGLLTPSAIHVVWGNDEYLYYSRGDEAGEYDVGRIIKVRMVKKSAPYYGRNN
ncbi:IPT/TIG domain-containing protein [candidate division KSB1 bacterium]|nr:IPT/TIG domain-containing protein [candidate division KSB1 bacterium]